MLVQFKIDNVEIVFTIYSGELASLETVLRNH